MPETWDAGAYDDLPLPHVAWGAWAVGALGLRGDERVLDAGCGTGRDLEGVLDAHPGVLALGLDLSAAMLRQAGERLARFGTRVRLVAGSITAPPDGVPPADAAFSVAALHWVADHDAAFAGFRALLRPGGRLVVDCGGAGNIARTDAAIAAAGLEPGTYTNFQGPDATRRRLERLGFTVEEAALVPSPTTLPDRATLARFLRTVVLGRHLAAMEADEGEAVLAQVVDALPDRTVDYVRLRVVATRGA